MQYIIYSKTLRDITRKTGPAKAGTKTQIEGKIKEKEKKI